MGGSDEVRGDKYADKYDTNNDTNNHTNDVYDPSRYTKGAATTMSAAAFSAKLGGDRYVGCVCMCVCMQGCCYHHECGCI